MMPTREPNETETNESMSIPEYTDFERPSLRTGYDVVTIRLNPTVSAEAVCDLRKAIGWGGREEDYPAAFMGYWGTVGAFDGADKLIGWCAILSDGVRHAVLLDVIVHPLWQRQGIGRQIVKQAIDHINNQGISVIHVDFRVEHAGFYRACGFRIGMGGIMST